MTHVTCRLNAKNRDQLWYPTLGNRVRATYGLVYIAIVRSANTHLQTVGSAHCWMLWRTCRHGTAVAGRWNATTSVSRQVNCCRGRVHHQLSRILSRHVHRDRRSRIARRMRYSLLWEISGVTMGCRSGGAKSRTSSSWQKITNNQNLQLFLLYGRLVYVGETCNRFADLGL